MLALHTYETSTCSGCGGWLPETTAHPELEDWDVDDPWRCGQCTAVSHAQDEHAKDHKHVHALRWAAVLKPA